MEKVFKVSITLPKIELVINKDLAKYVVEEEESSLEDYIRDLVIWDILQNITEDDLELNTNLVCVDEAPYWKGPNPLVCSGVEAQIITKSGSRKLVLD